MLLNIEAHVLKVAL